MEIFNKYVDWAARTFLSIDDGTKTMCAVKTHQHQEEKCYKGGGDYTCISTGRVITTVTRDCVKVDRFAEDYKMYMSQYNVFVKW